MSPTALQSSYRAPAAPSAASDQSENNPLRHVAVKIALGLIFLRFGMFHFLLLKLTHVNFHLIPLLGLPVMLGVALSGGLRRTFRGHPALYWSLYALWLMAAVPFSTWRGGSLTTVVGFTLVEYPMMFILGGLASNWRECRSVLHAIAWGAVVSVLAGFLMRGGREGARMALELGTMANANDYAAHLLLVLPFVLWVGLRSRWLRVPALGVFALGCYMILMTASRGAGIALLACLLFLLVRAPGRWRAAVIITVPVALLLLLTVVPSSVWTRLRALRMDTAGATEAVESMMLRQRTLQRGVAETLRHPFLGVGPAQFQNVAGQAEKLWLVPHNTYVEISSECGIPALIAYLAGIVSTFLLFHSTYNQCRRRDDCNDIRNAALCVMLGMVGYCVASTFLSLAYTFYMPALGGFAVALALAARREIGERETLSAASGATAGGRPWAAAKPAAVFSIGPVAPRKQR